VASIKLNDLINNLERNKPVRLKKNKMFEVQ
jgi:hypothetical protein